MGFGSFVLCALWVQRRHLYSLSSLKWVIAFNIYVFWKQWFTCSQFNPCSCMIFISCPALLIPFSPELRLYRHIYPSAPPPLCEELTIPNEYLIYWLCIRNTSLCYKSHRAVTTNSNWIYFNQNVICFKCQSSGDNAHYEWYNFPFDLCQFRNDKQKKAYSKHSVHTHVNGIVKTTYCCNIFEWFYQAVDSISRIFHSISLIWLFRSYRSLLFFIGSIKLYWKPLWLSYHITPG